MIGFETVGNATVICHDGRPIFCTDPWISGSAYFGSWTHKFAIPPEQMAAIDACDMVWFSHGHPDHLNPESLPHFAKKTILLPDHVGGRIAAELSEKGFTVRVLETKKWYQLSNRIRVLCLPDYNQDAILLIELNGRLLVNMNDATHRDWMGFIRRVTKRYDKTFLLRLVNHGDTDMINMFDEEGSRVLPPGLKSVPLGVKIQQKLVATGCKSYVPFSTLHVYQRTDSIWANEYVVMDPAEFAEGFPGPLDHILPVNVRYDCVTDNYEGLSPDPVPLVPQPPEAFGDNWQDRLEADEKALARRYFSEIDGLRRSLDFVRVVVGGEETMIELTKRRFKTGITFELPRASLVAAMKWEIFDDVLLGNYMKTTLHGIKGLHPGFTPYVAKYADNGRAKTAAEIETYWQHYRARNPIGMIRHELALKTTHRLRSYVLSDGQMIKWAYNAYRRLHAIPTPARDGQHRPAAS